MTKITMFKPSFTQPNVYCGKKECTMCPHQGYWYMQLWNPVLKKEQCHYIGKKFSIYFLNAENDKLKKIVI